MSPKMATPAFLKIKVLRNKCYYVKYYVYDVTNKLLLHDSNYNVDVVMWPKFDNSRKESYHNLNFIRILPEKPVFFEGWCWLKFNNLRLALGTNLKFYTNLSKGFKLKVRKFWRLILTFVEVTGEKLVGEPCCPSLQSWIGLKETDVIVEKHGFK